METWLQKQNIKEEVYVDPSTTHVEKSLTETFKAFVKQSTKDVLQKGTDNMMASSKTRNYHIYEIIYNLYKDNIFQNKK